MDKDEILQQWIDKAKEDLRVAEYLSAMHHPTPDEIICFHCQQSAEKYFKAVLFANDIEPPNSHDLKRLLEMCQPYNAEFSKLSSNAYVLTRYGVMPRYPNELGITKEDMKNAIVSAKNVQDFVLKVFNKSSFSEN